MWIVTVIQMAKAPQSCTKVAPVRHESGNGQNQRMIEPVSSITGRTPAMKMAFSFWPALNLPHRSLADLPRDRSHRRSLRVHRESRPASLRNPVRQRPTRMAMTGIGSATPDHTWISSTSSRRPTMADSGPK